MAIAPRFRRVAALQRPFVDREHILADFAGELERIGTGPRVFNVTGVGGIGKSRLLRELKDRAAPRFRTATIDLQVPALRNSDDSLAVLRGQLGSRGVSFDRFDIAYAVLWQRLHPHLRLSKAELSFVEDSAILTDILDSLSGLPIFGTAMGLVKALERGSTDVRRRFRIKRDATLHALDALPNPELADAVTFLFAEDLRAGSTDRPAVIVIDTYEALVPTPARVGRVQLADAWLRDLVGQLDCALVVIGSREPLRWELHDPEWASIIRVCGVDGLPMTARLELLQAGGISEAADRQIIADASAGLPFYLHLAVDTHSQGGGRIGSAVVSRDEILGRFLQHVAPEEIRSLELLGPARVFDYDIFRRLSGAFSLPRHRLAWDSLTAYSFVYPAGEALRLHQLIRAAVQERLPPATLTEIHTLLRGLWDDRAAQATGTDGGAAGARALREAAYHGVRAGQVSAVGLLDYTDRAVRRGGHGASAGIEQDIQEWLTERPGDGDGDGDGGRDGIAEALRCLRAEAAVRLGDAAAAIALTPATGMGVDTPVGARLAVAGGHGRRIAGDTREALEAFLHVWEHADGGPRLAAGLWAADLHMCQGRFSDAETLAADLEILTPAQESEFRGDVARLRHLTRRFAFDVGAARRYLDAAAGHYRDADSVLGLANVATNRAELLALTSPAEAIVEAGQAIEIHREIGALHELGKAYTALAVAQLRRGDLDAAEASLRSASASLEQAGYRSGRARAELYLAVIHARRGRLDEAVSSLRWAVAELEAADVYPTLIRCAARILDRIGVPDRGIAAAAHRATLQPLGTFQDLEDRIDAFVVDLLGAHSWKPEDLYREALARTDSASGFYNDNVKIAAPTGPVIVRIPIPETDVMDLAIWPESGVLRAIRDTITHAPRLLHANDSPRFQILEYIDGRLLDVSAPRGVHVPGHVIDDVADLFRRLGDVPRERLPPLPLDWPADGQSAAFARRLSAVTRAVYARFQPEFGQLFVELGIPVDPLSPIISRWAALQQRPFRLLHTDIHRKNMVLAGGRTYFLDWELALWGDPVYDLAVHLHKMGYQPVEHAAMETAWLTAVPGHAAENWQPDLNTYLAHERVKSAIVDTVRYTKLIARGAHTADREAELIGKLVDKLRAARTAGGGWANGRPLDQAKATALVRRWSGRAG
jgi:aminoglycoside phosphotransferase (APT) family kinase protein/cellobiose-specific phosphotransferase system component IIA